MFLALFANLRVLRLSEKLVCAGVIIAMKVVLQFPPRLSSRSLVSLESRYGMCDRGLLEVSAAITFPKADSD